MIKEKRSLNYFILIVVVALIGINSLGGKLYIKPELERARAARLLQEGDADFRNGKIHITLSPEIALEEFKLAKERYKQAVEIIKIYGEGYFTPGDLDDFEKKVKECDSWTLKASQGIKDKEQQKTVFE